MWALMIRLHSPLDWTERVLGDHNHTILGASGRCFWRLLSCGTTDGQRSVLNVDGTADLGSDSAEAKGGNQTPWFFVSRCILPLEQSSFFTLPTQTRASNSRKFLAIRFRLVWSHWSWNFQQPRLSNYGVLQCRCPLCVSGFWLCKPVYPPFFSRELNALLYVQMDSTHFVSIAYCGFYFGKRKMGLKCKQNS